MATKKPDRIIPLNKPATNKIAAAERAAMAELNVWSFDFVHTNDRLKSWSVAGQKLTEERADVAVVEVTAYWTAFLGDRRFVAFDVTADGQVYWRGGVDRASARSLSLLNACERILSRGTLTSAGSAVRAVTLLSRDGADGIAPPRRVEAIAPRAMRAYYLGLPATGKTISSAKESALVAARRKGVQVLEEAPDGTVRGVRDGYVQIAHPCQDGCIRMVEIWRVGEDEPEAVL